MLYLTLRYTFHGKKIWFLVEYCKHSWTGRWRCTSDRCGPRFDYETSRRATETALGCFWSCHTVTSAAKLHGTSEKGHILLQAWWCFCARAVSGQAIEEKTAAIRYGLMAVLQLTQCHWSSCISRSRQIRLENRTSCSENPDPVPKLWAVGSKKKKNKKAKIKDTLGTQSKCAARSPKVRDPVWKLSWIETTTPSFST